MWWRPLCMYTEETLSRNSDRKKCSLYVMVMCLCIYACMYKCMYKCMYVCMQACMYTCMYACKHVCIHACMYVYMQACMYVIIINNYPSQKNVSLHYLLKKKKKNFSSKVSSNSEASASKLLGHLQKGFI